LYCLFLTAFACYAPLAQWITRLKAYGNIGEVLLTAKRIALQLPTNCNAPMINRTIKLSKGKGRENVVYEKGDYQVVADTCFETQTYSLQSSKLLNKTSKIHLYN
jgi:hypothetical protein